MALRVVPLTLSEANELVSRLHRHHKPVVGHRFSIGVQDSFGQMRGCAIIGRPVARMTDQYRVAEVTRLVTDGTKNACSILYAAAARAAKAMGFDHIQSFILDNEPGTSLKASGWTCDGVTSGGDWNHGPRKGRRTDQPMCPKQRWIKMLNDVEQIVPVLNQCEPLAIQRFRAWNAKALELQAFLDART